MSPKDTQAPAGSAWYAAGLCFACTGCGNCCSGGPGYVWVTEDELLRIAAFLGISPQKVVRAYCRTVGRRLCLREVRSASGQYDCVFLASERDATGRPTGRRLCTVYHARPVQCRTWPFWYGNLVDPAAWKHAADKCPGIDSGRRWSLEEIEAARNMNDW